MSKRAGRPQGSPLLMAGIGFALALALSCTSDIETAEDILAQLGSSSSAEPSGAVFCMFPNGVCSGPITLDACNFLDGNIVQSCGTASSSPSSAAVPLSSSVVPPPGSSSAVLYSSSNAESSSSEAESSSSVFMPSSSSIAPSSSVLPSSSSSSFRSSNSSSSITNIISSSSSSNEDGGGGIGIGDLTVYGFSTAAGGSFADLDAGIAFMQGQALSYPNAGEIDIVFNGTYIYSAFSVSEEYPYLNPLEESQASLIYLGGNIANTASEVLQNNADAGTLASLKMSIYGIVGTNAVNKIEAIEGTVFAVVSSEGDIFIAKISWKNGIESLGLTYLGL